MSPRRFFIMLMTILASDSLKAVLPDILSFTLGVFVIGKTSACVGIGWSTKASDVMMFEGVSTKKEKNKEGVVIGN